MNWFLKSYKPNEQETSSSLKNRIYCKKGDEDVSHCNFESPEIVVTSKGLMRNSTYKMNKTITAIEDEKGEIYK